MTSLEALKLELRVSKRVTSYSCLERCIKRIQVYPLKHFWSCIKFLVFFQGNFVQRRRLVTCNKSLQLQKFLNKTVSLHSTTNTSKDYLSNVVNLKTKKMSSSIGSVLLQSPAHESRMYDFSQSIETGTACVKMCRFLFLYRKMHEKNSSIPFETFL